MKILLAAFVGALFVFLWSIVSHTVLPGLIGMGELGTAPDLATERALQHALTGLKEAGVYLIPGVGGASADKAEAQAFEERQAQGPFAFVVYDPDGEADLSRQLSAEFAANLLAALLAALVLSRTRCAYPTRVLLVALMGAFGWLSLLVSYWTRYRFPDGFVLFEAVDQVGRWLVAGLMMAAMVEGKEG